MLVWFERLKMHISDVKIFAVLSHNFTGKGHAYVIVDV
jgi:hypothetical protein